MQQTSAAQINQNPNITAGFKNNIASNLPQIQNPQTLQQVQQPMAQIQQPMPQIQQQLAQVQQLPQPLSQVQQVVQPQILPDVVVVDTFTILGMDLQKKYVYIALLLILGIAAYFVWKWWYGPKKSKKSKKSQEDEESYSEEEEEEEEEEDVYIPQYSGKTNSESKGNKKNE